MQEGFEEKLHSVGKPIRKLWKPGRDWNKDRGDSLQFAGKGRWDTELQRLSEMTKVTQLNMDFHKNVSRPLTQDALL